MAIDESKSFTPINIAILTVSDTRTAENDTSGDILAERVASAGHNLAARTIVKDDAALLATQFNNWIDDPQIDAIVSTGGTGLTGRDVTPEALSRIDGGFLVFLIAALAEVNRAPFDMPEAEQELTAGYHTEYSGFRWGLFMLSEYGMMLLIAFLGVILFFGGWNTPFPNIGSSLFAEWTTGPVWGIFWLTGKALVWIFLQMWVRWTYPRLRVDQLMNLSWKYLTPIAIIMLFVCGIWRLWMV